MSSRSVNVGVAVVHGIGLQKPAETLAKFGEPTADWLTDWVAETGSDVRIEVERKHEDREAITVVLASDDAPPERWMFVETHWADSFTAPPYGRFIAWLLRAVPWTTLWLLGSPLVAVTDAVDRAGSWESANVSALLLQHVRHPLRTLGRLAGFAGALTSGLLEIVLRLACLLLALPFVILFALLGVVPALRQFIIPLLGTLGDSYAFIAFPAERDAMLARLKADVAYLEERCDRVVIVAHSQGAALAHQALIDSERRRRCTFISLGAGVAPLTGLSVIQQSSRSWWLLGIATVALLAVGEGVLVAAMVPGLGELLEFAFVGAMMPLLQIRELMAGTVWSADLSAIHDLNTTWFGYMAAYQKWAAANDVLVVMLLFVLAPPLMLIGSWFRKTRAIERWHQAVRLRKRVRNRIRWVDVYTARDPVPIGRMLASYANSSVQVTNRASLTRDHSSYEQNRHEVLPLVAREIAACGGYADRLFPRAMLDRLSAAQQARAVAVARAARWADLAALGALVGIVFAGVTALGGRPGVVWPTLAGVSLAGFALARRRVRARAAKASLLADPEGDERARRARVRPYGWVALTGLVADAGLVLTVAPYPPGEVVPATGEALLDGVGRLPVVTIAALGFLLALVALIRGRRWGLHLAIASALVTAGVVMPIWPLAGAATLTSVALLAVLAWGLWSTRAAGGTPTSAAA